MTSPGPNPLQRYLPVQGVVDKELAAILRDAADDAEKSILSLAGKGGIGAEMQRSQYALMVRELREMQGQLWGSVTPALEKNMLRAGQAAAEAEKAVDALFWQGLGTPPMSEYTRAMEIRAQAAVRAYIAKTDNGIPLADSVYKAQAQSTDAVNREVRRAILTGQSARQLADRVKGLIRPDVKGGVSYAARRLARTELNNAFHRAQIDQRRGDPFTKGFKWHLSGSHPRPDACNDYADNSHFSGGEKGVFRASEVPGKPHPNCLCFITTVQKSEEQMLNEFLGGQYNTYLDEQIYKYAPHVSPCGRR